MCLMPVEYSVENVVLACRLPTVKYKRGNADLLDKITQMLYNNLVEVNTNPKKDAVSN